MQVQRERKSREGRVQKCKAEKTKRRAEREATKQS